MEKREHWKPAPGVTEKVKQAYLAGRSGFEIAADLGVDPSRIYYQLHLGGVKRRSSAGLKRRKTCRTCGGSFASSSNNAQFCSKVCQYGEATCECCGKAFTKRAPSGGGRPGSRLNVFCSRPCEARGRRVPDLRRIRDDGYVVVRLPDGWPWGGNGSYQGTMLEHRMVMTLHLDRRLEAHETVHHINGDKTDNRLENLQLRTGRHGRGVALECLDCGSHNVEAVPLEGHSSS